MCFLFKLIYLNYICVLNLLFNSPIMQFNMFDIIHSKEFSKLGNYRIFKRRYPQRSSLPTRTLRDWYIQLLESKENNTQKSLCLVGIHKDALIRTSPVTSIINPYKICTNNCIYILTGESKVIENPINGLEKHFLNGFPQNWESLLKINGRRLTISKPKNDAESYFAKFNSSVVSNNYQQELESKKVKEENPDAYFSNSIPGCKTMHQKEEFANFNDKIAGDNGFREEEGFSNFSDKIKRENNLYQEKLDAFPNDGTSRRNSLHHKEVVVNFSDESFRNKTMHQEELDSYYSDKVIKDNTLHLEEITADCGDKGIRNDSLLQEEEFSNFSNGILCNTDMHHEELGYNSSDSVSDLNIMNQEEENAKYNDKNIEHHHISDEKKLEINKYEENTLKDDLDNLLSNVSFKPGEPDDEEFSEYDDSLLKETPQTYTLRKRKRKSKASVESFIRKSPFEYPSNKSFKGSESMIQENFNINRLSAPYDPSFKKVKHLELNSNRMIEDLRSINSSASQTNKKGISEKISKDPVCDEYLISDNNHSQVESVIDKINMSLNDSRVPDKNREKDSIDHKFSLLTSFFESSDNYKQKSDSHENMSMFETPNDNAKAKVHRLSEPTLLVSADINRNKILKDDNINRPVNEYVTGIERKCMRINQPIEEELKDISESGKKFNTLCDTQSNIPKNMNEEEEFITLCKDQENNLTPRFSNDLNTHKNGLDAPSSNLTPSADLELIKSQSLDNKRISGSKKPSIRISLKTSKKISIPNNLTIVPPFKNNAITLSEELQSADILDDTLLSSALQENLDPIASDLESQKSSTISFTNSNKSLCEEMPKEFDKKDQPQESKRESNTLIETLPVKIVSSVPNNDEDVINQDNNLSVVNTKPRKSNKKRSKLVMPKKLKSISRRK